MLTPEEIQELEETQKIIDEGANWGAQQALKSGIPIFYRNDTYPETMEGNLFVKEYPNGVRFLVQKTLTADNRLLEEMIRPLT